MRVSSLTCSRLWRAERASAAVRAQERAVEVQRLQARHTPHPSSFLAFGSLGNVHCAGNFANAAGTLCGAGGAPRYAWTHLAVADGADKG